MIFMLIVKKKTSGTFYCPSLKVINFFVAFFSRKESYVFGNILLSFLLTKIFFFFSLEWNKDEEVRSYKSIERKK